jgi:hypothetical protein
MHDQQGIFLALLLIKPPVTLYRKTSLHTAIVRLLGQYGTYWKYRSWRSHRVALCLAVIHFSLAICPDACCRASLLVLRPNAACT